MYISGLGWLFLIVAAFVLLCLILAARRFSSCVRAGPLYC